MREDPMTPSFSVPYDSEVLPNGLNVIFHEDHTLPRVVLNVLYNVGAKDDPKGRSGMAHLFEHLMFMGTRAVPEGEMDRIMEQAGGSNNAFTGEDITVYYDLGPARLLETFLFIESDRMASLSDAFSRYEEVPPILTQMVRVGEETGSLASILNTLAKFYKREVDDAVDTLVGLIEPIMIVTLGVGVGLLLVSVLVPIYNIASSIQ